MAINIKGTSNELEVNEDKEALVALTKVLDKSGYAIQVAEVDNGSITAEKTLRQLDVSNDYRLRVGVDSLLWDDNFNHGVFNTSKYLGVTATMNMTLAGGALNMNSSNSVTSGHVARKQTMRTFPLFGTYGTYTDVWFSFSAAPQANSFHEFGLFTSSGTTIPTDGVLFRLAGTQLMGVTNYNGAEQTANIELGGIVINKMYHGLIVTHQDRVEFWVDDVLHGVIATPIGLPSPCMSMYQPLAVRQYNNGTVASAIQTKIAKWSVNLVDMNSNRLWATAMVGNGQSAISNYDGVAVGQSANYANNAVPATGTPSNNAAAYTTLGGQWQIVAPAGAETDLVLFGFTLAPQSPNSSAKNMMVRGIRIETINVGAAVAITATCIQWGLGVGSTAVSLATAESATAGTKAARRIALGYQSFPIGAAIGTVATPIDMNFDVPLIVEAGTFFHVILKVFIGTATASQILRGTCFVNAFYE